LSFKCADCFLLPEISVGRAASHIEFNGMSAIGRSCCRRFRVAWQSSKQLAACKLQVVARYFRCDLIFDCCCAFCTSQTRRVSVLVAFLSRLPAPSTRFFRAACLRSFSSCVHPIPHPCVPNFSASASFGSCASLLIACTCLLHPVEG
jgi:hypothetical protein